MGVKYMAGSKVSLLNKDERQVVLALQMSIPACAALTISWTLSKRGARSKRFCGTAGEMAR
jgi:hypothetical protein